MNSNQHTGHFTGSNHEYTLFEHTAVVQSTYWLHLDTFHLCSMLYHRPQLSTRLLNTWKTIMSVMARACSGHLYSVNYQYSLSEPTVVAYYSADWLHLTTFSSMQHAPPQPQGSLTPGKTALPWTPVSILAILVDQSHTMNTLSEHTVVAHIANWLHRDTFSPMQYAPPLLQSYNTPGKTVLLWSKSKFWPLILQQTMNAHFLSHCSGL